MGAVPIVQGKRATDPNFTTLIDPRQPIPESSTRFHGVTDAMVRDAPVFPVALARFESFRGDRVVIGYSIGFDFAIMAREAGRVGLNWRQPRSLCVRMLGGVANPNLPDQSMETLAGWLGVELTERHSAIGDAKAAADLFLALLPRLKSQGITTLAEAERACLRQTGEMEAHQKAGWAPPVQKPEEQRAFGSVDPYAYRHRVGEIMGEKLRLVADTMPVRQAMSLMTEARISSVLVSPTGEPGGLVADYAILTERDVLRLMAREGEAAFARSVGEVASKPLVSVAQEAFVYRAIGRMDRFRIRHLAVRDENDRLVGIISARDLLKLRGAAAIELDDAIEAAQSPAQMAQAWATVPSVADRLIAEEIDARIVAGIVSEELRIMTRRAGALAEASMVAEGFGPPPCPFSLLVLGSGGRGESLLAADQDNAVVYQEGEPDSPQDRWFGEFGSRVADMLNAAGIPYCTGGVMAMNAPWRGSVDLWRKRLSHWIGRAEPEDLLNVDIVFDLRPVHGDPGLGSDLFNEALSSAHAHPAFAKLLGERAGDFGSAFTIFGNIRSIDGRIDLKKYGLFPIVSVARALAIRHDVRRRSTHNRLEGLLALNLGEERSLRGLLDAQELFLALMLAQQSQDLHAGVPVSNRIALDRLTASQTDKLKAALRTVETIPSVFRALMGAQPRLDPPGAE